MNHPQIIKTPAGEDAMDVRIYDERRAALREEDKLPAEVSMAILRGDSRLKALRKWRGVTQSELAGRAGVSQGFLSDAEARRRTVSGKTAASLAAALDIPPDWVEG